MCDDCLNDLHTVTYGPSIADRLRGFFFRIKINYRVFRYATNKKYAAKWEAEHFKPLLDKAGQEEPYPWWDTEKKENS